MPAGRPPALVWDEELKKKIAGCARIGCTHRETAAFLGVAYQTWMTFKKNHPEAHEAFEDSFEIGKVSLRRNQFRLAEKNVAMAIWLGKQYLGQRDYRDFGTTDAGMTEDEKKAAILNTIREAEANV